MGDRAFPGRLSGLSFFVKLVAIAYIPFFLVLFGLARSFYWPSVIAANLWMLAIVRSGLKDVLGFRSCFAWMAAATSALLLWLSQYTFAVLGTLLSRFGFL